MFRLYLPFFLLVGCAEAPSGEPSETTDPPPEVCGPDAAVGLQIGMCAPDFELPDRYAKPFTLSSQRGKVALVDISAIW